MSHMLSASTAADRCKKSTKISIAPCDQGSKLWIRFFALRLERSSLYNPDICHNWQLVVEDHMAKRSQKSKKLIVKENSFKDDVDSGFSDSG